MTTAYKEAFDARRVCVGRREQQPCILVEHLQFDQQRRLDLSIGSKQARNLSDREGDAAQGRHVPYAAAQRPSRSVQLSRAVFEPRHGLFEEPEGG